MSFSYTVGGKSFTQQQQRGSGRKQSTSKGRGLPNPSDKSDSSTARGLTVPVLVGGQRTGSNTSTVKLCGGEAGTIPVKFPATNARGASDIGNHGVVWKSTHLKSGNNLRSDIASQTNVVTLSNLKSKNKANQSRICADVTKSRATSKIDHNKSIPNDAQPQHHSGRKVGRGVQSNFGASNFSPDRAAKSLTSNYKQPEPGLGNKPPLARNRVSRVPKQGRSKTMADRGLYSLNERRVGQRAPQAQDHGDSLSQPGSDGRASSQQQAQGIPQQEQPQERASAGYRMISPNEKKRQQLTSQASKELEAYEARRAARKPTIIRGEAQRTGGQKSEEEARLAMEKEHRDKKYDQIRKREQWEREKREREDRELDKKKARAREQTRKNEQRQATRESGFIRNDHATTNEQHFQRLEGRTQRMSEGHNQSSQSSASKLRKLAEMFPDKKVSKLQELLDYTNQDIDKVIDLLRD